MTRLTKKLIRERAAAAARGEFDRGLLWWAIDVGLTFQAHGPHGTLGAEYASLPVLAERDGLRLIGHPGHKLLVGIDQGYWRAWLVEYDGPAVPQIVMPGVTGAAAVAD